MSITTHLESLSKKHHDLECAIESAYSSHVPDNEISALKKQRLLLKEEIESFIQTKH